MNECWKNFETGKWTVEIDVHDFIQKNYHPFAEEPTFLAGPTEKTEKLWGQVLELMKEEVGNGGVLDADTKTVSSIVSHDAGYIDKELEVVVGLQTERPFKRAIMPYGGARLVKSSLESYGFEFDKGTEEIFSKYRKTHNDGVFDAYTDEMRRARSSGIITGLPDSYGRGRIIGDYRRVALYGIDLLIKEKMRQKKELETTFLELREITLREEVSEQIKALNELKEMGSKYGFDLSRPAENAVEAVQWTYFGYLGAIKEQNGAAMSIGRVSTFLDIYFERDIEAGLLTEEEAQEIIDHFVMKLRMVRFLRPPEYNELFSGDPVWVTEVIGGMGVDGRPLVTKTSYRVLHTLYNLGPAPEPNLTILWSTRLPEPFKRYCAKCSIDTSSIQYENDDQMRGFFGDDYAIACCVSAMTVGKQMQFFGARANLAKALLYAINGGRDEISGQQIGPEFRPVASEYLDFDDVWNKFDKTLDWLARLYINTLNVIHFMHDKYSYERLQMALHDKFVLRTMAGGIAGLSVVADSLSAIKHTKVKAIRNEEGLIVDYELEGEYPAYGNNEEWVDNVAQEVTRLFMEKLRAQKTYRYAKPTLSILTITSNVVYGKKTGNTPDGRKYGEPFAPGANPMHNRDKKGAIASMASVAKLPYEHAQDGISYTFSIIPGALGKNLGERVDNLVALMDGYFEDTGHHINVNVLEQDMLLDAMEHPEKYPQLTVRVSGYAVNFIKLTREQQMDVINRTFHTKS